METKIDYEWFKENLLQYEIVSFKFGNKDCCIVVGSLTQWKWGFYIGGQLQKTFESFNDMMSEKLFNGKTLYEYLCNGDILFEFV